MNKANFRTCEPRLQGDCFRVTKTCFFLNVFLWYTPLSQKLGGYYPSNFEIIYIYTIYIYTQYISVYFFKYFLYGSSGGITPMIRDFRNDCLSIWDRIVPWHGHSAGMSAESIQKHSYPSLIKHGWLGNPRHKWACHRKTTENGAFSSHVWVLRGISQLIRVDLMLQTLTNPGGRGQKWDLLRPAWYRN